MTNETQYILAIRPGSAAETPLRAPWTERYLKLNFKEIIDYALGLNHDRKAGRTAEAIKVEMTREYGLTANGRAVNLDTKITDYFVDDHITEPATGKVRSFRKLELTVASKQTGGNGLEKRMYER